MTPWQMIEWASSRFEKSHLYYGHGTDNAHDEAVFIVLQKLQLPLDSNNPALNEPLSDEQENIVRAVVEERIRSRKPAAYILGRAWFAGLSFYVDENVLVPRSPIAELIREQFSPWCDAGKVKRILDIGTGCGCIAIASAFAFPQATVDALDISNEALAVAAKNVEYHALQERVTLIQSDLFKNIGDNKFDLIIANPPYVDEEDMAALPDEYKHEPVAGLYAGGDGLLIVRRILHEAADHLTENGVLVVEVGNSQYALAEKYPDVPFLWLEFEYGGEGVFLLSREELQQYFS